MSELSPAPRSICILRLSALGDTTHVIPVVKSLQAQWPQARITWIIGRFEHRLLRLLPGVEFVVFDKKAGRAGRRALSDALRGRHFDVLMLMQLSLRANWLSRKVRASVRLGYDAMRSKEGHSLFINRRIPDHPRGHVVDTLMQFATSLGAKPVWDWSLPAQADDEQWAREMAPTQPFAILSPCSSHRLRNWTVAGYIALAQHMYQRWGLQVVLCGGPSELEQQTAAAIEQAVPTAVTNLVGQDTLPQFLALMRQARLLVTPDSGPAHMATVAGIPVLGLYAATDPARSGPYHWRAHCANAYAQAAQQFRGKPAEELRWGSKIEEPGVMELLHPEAVCAAVDAILQQD